jgi:hypothetical protein
LGCERRKQLKKKRKRKDEAQEDAWDR